MKKKWKYIYTLKKKTNERGLYSLHPSLTFSPSPAHVWKIPCCHLLRQDSMSTNEIPDPPKKVIVEKREKEWVRVLEMEEERREGSDRGRRRTSSYNRLLGSVMKQLSDIFSCLLLSCFSICLSYQVFVSPSPSPLLCPLSLICLS